jgi:hypothetical protein
MDESIAEFLLKARAAGLDIIGPFFVFIITFGGFAGY